VNSTADDSTSDSLVGNCVKYGEEFGQLAGAGGLADADTVDKFFSELAADVPSDLKDDVATLEQSYTTFADAVRAAGGDISKAATDPDVQKAITGMSSAEVLAASNAMEKWFSDGCPG